MKKAALLLSLFGYNFNAQVVLQQDFTSPFTPATAGWYLQNESYSVTANTTTWYQGDPINYFPAYTGQPVDYFAADFNSTDPGAIGDISNWLITPTVTIYNGAVLQFATRTVDQGPTNNYPDRMQVRMSTAGTTSVISPGGPSNVGTFTNLLLDINPNLNSSTVSVVSNGTMVNGYPNVWTIYTVGISGITGTVTGRFAFRYYVPGGGLLSNLSFYVGVDAVKYTLPCGAAVPSYTVCSGNSVTLAATGGLASTSYSWSTSSVASSITVNPATTTVYTLNLYNGNILCGPGVTSTVTIGPGLSVSVTASQATVCGGQTVVLSAISGASTYSWSTGSTTNSAVVTPTVSTTYSVGAANSNLTCFGGNTVFVSVNASPQLTITKSPFPICIGDTVLITLSGANSYTFLGSSQNPQAVPVPTTTGTYTFDAYGVSVNGCYGYIIDSVVVNPVPVVVANASPSGICINATATLSASGAITYTWTGSVTSTAASVTYSSATAGTKYFTVIGSNSVGCTAKSSINLLVSPYPNITAVIQPTSLCVNETATATAGGGVTYTWTGASASTAGSFIFTFFSAGVKNFTVTGSNAYGCMNTASANVTFNDCTGILQNADEKNYSLFPNPFGAELSILNLNGHVEIYNLLGEKLLSATVRSSETLNTGALPPGVYLIKFFDQDFNEAGIKKVIKE